jgi:formylglycine-generating enzyme required for sulfatase activity
MRLLLVFLLSACANVDASPENMIRIPGGEFIMGMEGDLDDNTAHKVSVDGFYIDKHEVTNAEYLEYCKATDARMPEFWGKEGFNSGPDFPNHPVVGVSWQEAKDYAEWCGKRLPTEAEWEYAARGGLVDKPYPNGDEMDAESANYTHSEKGSPVEVGSYPANGYGLYDMAGNVSEWVEDWYGADYYKKSPAQNPTGPEKGKFRVFRGGGWHSGPYCVRVVHRNGLPLNFRDFNVGFRCAKDANE